jgi:antitoxin ParD1/3/4
MNLVLPLEVQNFINEQVNSGKYSSPEGVVAAAIMALDQQQFDEFEAGELDELIAEGERSIEQEGTLDGEEAFLQLRQRCAQKRLSSQ